MANSFIILQFTGIVCKYYQRNNLKSKFVGYRDFVANWNYAFVLSMFYNHIDEGEPVQAIIISNGVIVRVKNIHQVEGIRDQIITFPQNDIRTATTTSHVGQKWFQGFIKLFTPELSVTFSIKKWLGSPCWVMEQPCLTTTAHPVPG